MSFDAYIDEVESEYREHQVQSKSKEKTRGSKLELSGLTEEELLKQQEELFERARLRMNSTSVVEAEVAVEEPNTEQSHAEELHADDTNDIIA